MWCLRHARTLATLAYVVCAEHKSTYPRDPLLLINYSKVCAVHFTTRARKTKTKQNSRVTAVGRSVIGQSHLAPIGLRTEGQRQQRRPAVSDSSAGQPLTPLHVPPSPSPTLTNLRPSRQIPRHDEPTHRIDLAQRAAHRRLRTDLVVGRPRERMQCTCCRDFRGLRYGAVSASTLPRRVRGFSDALRCRLAQSNIFWLTAPPARRPHLSQHPAASWLHLPPAPHLVDRQAVSQGTSPRPARGRRTRRLEHVLLHAPGRPPRRR